MSFNTKPLFMLGLPTNGEHSFLFTQFLLGTSYPTNFSMEMRAVPGYEVGDARNILVAEAIRIGAKYLMFIDEDVLGPGNGVRKLLFLLETHPDWTVAGGVYATKGLPPEPLIFTEWAQGAHWGWKQGELLKVRASGMGFHMLRVSDVAAMKTPQAYHIRNPWTGGDMEVRQWFKTGKEYVRENGLTTLEAHTEDFWFYKMMEDEGLQAWIDTGVWCRHYEKSQGVLYEVPADSGVAVKPDPWNHTPRVANLGAGNIIDPYEVSVDLRDDPRLTYRCDIRQLPDDWDNQFDVVKANHVLEHFSWQSTLSILKEWARIIKPGGRMELRVPDIEWAAQHILNDEGFALTEYLQGCLYGDQGAAYWRQGPYGGHDENGRHLPHANDYNHHKAGFTPTSLGSLMLKAGLVEVEGKKNDFEFFISGKKPAETPAKENDGETQLLNTGPGDGQARAGDGEARTEEEKGGEEICADEKRQGQKGGQTQEVHQLAATHDAAGRDGNAAADRAGVLV